MKGQAHIVRMTPTAPRAKARPRFEIWMDLKNSKGRWLAQVVRGYFAYHAVPELEYK
jgi:hypothetical protein